MAVQSPKRDVKITQKEALSSQDPNLFQIDIFKKHKYPDLSGVLFAPPPVCVRQTGPEDRQCF